MTQVCFTQCRPNGQMGWFICIPNSQTADWSISWKTAWWFLREEGKICNHQVSEVGRAIYCTVLYVTLINILLNKRTRSVLWGKGWEFLLRKFLHISLKCMTLLFGGMRVILCGIDFTNSAAESWSWWVLWVMVQRYEYFSVFVCITRVFLSKITISQILMLMWNPPKCAHFLLFQSLCMRLSGVRMCNLICLEHFQSSVCPRGLRGVLQRCSHNGTRWFLSTVCTISCQVHSTRTHEYRYVMTYHTSAEQGQGDRVSGAVPNTEKQKGC